jgi:bacterioferritin
MADKPFLTDVKTLRSRARQHIEQGAVTPGYRADRDKVVQIPTSVVSIITAAFGRFENRDGMWLRIF